MAPPSSTGSRLNQGRERASRTFKDNQRGQGYNWVLTRLAPLQIQILRQTPKIQTAVWRQRALDLMNMF